MDLFLCIHDSYIYPKSESQTPSSISLTAVWMTLKLFVLTKNVISVSLVTANSFMRSNCNKNNLADVQIW